MTFTATSKMGYTLTQDGTRIEVTNTPNNPPKVLQTTVDEKGVTEVVNTYKALFGVEPAPLIMANPVSGSKNWGVDHAAGFMRWTGFKSTRELFSAFRKLGFEPSSYQEAARLARIEDRRMCKASAA